MRGTRSTWSAGVIVLFLAFSGCTSAIIVAEPPGLDMGIDADAVEALAAQGIRVRYGTVWVGAWNLEFGWGGTEESLRALLAQNVTPLVQFYYWGDDLTPECFHQGCMAGATIKSPEGWRRVATEFSALIQQVVGDRPIVIVVESEFNKKGMHESDAWDRALADMTLFLRGQLANARFVLGFGNWSEGYWAGFDEAVAAADAVGLQAMRATTIDDTESYLHIAERTVVSAKRLQEEFGKPILLHDVALSSFPEPDGSRLQEAAMREWVAAAPRLSEAGVEAFVYRSYWDTPTTFGYFGPAEQHWGLVEGAGGSPKPALDEWTRWALRNARAMDQASTNAEYPSGNSSP